MEPMLTTAEAAALKGCKSQYIRKCAKDGEFNAEMTMVNGSQHYTIPLSALDAKWPGLEAKYYQQKRQAMITSLVKVLPDQRPPSEKALECYSEEERRDIAFWTDMVAEWQSYRHKPGANATEVDKRFVELCKLRNQDHAISIDILYRRWNAIRAGNLDGLIDRRGKHLKGKSRIEDVIWQAFLFYYLDESQHPIMKCYDYAKLWAQSERPELVGYIPHYSTFYRHLKQDIPNAVETLGREGDKAFQDRCAPYIRRIYDDMASNEWWVADNHTFDIISEGENGKRHRLYLTAFFDARSGIFTGCHVTDAPCSQATLIALRKGILKYGIPDNIYVDNGREFLTFDIGGLGHRAKKPKDGKERFDPPPVFARLGIQMTNAIVRNAKAKIIERRFRDIKDHLSRLFETFTGGNVVEKPERLKSVLKNGAIPTDATLISTVETLLEGYFNQQEYGGSVAEDQGKTRMEVYSDYLYSKRVASAEDLNLMLMRSARPQQVTRRGVHLDIAGQRIDYWNDDMVFQLKGKQVYFRYDPENLAEVRIYDLEDRFIMVVPADNTAVLTYGASQEEVKAAISKTKHLKRLTKEAISGSILPFVDQRTALDLVLRQAGENRTGPAADPKVLTIQRAEEEPLLKVVGATVDLNVMTRNAEKKRGGAEHE